MKDTLNSGARFPEPVQAEIKPGSVTKGYDKARKLIEDLTAAGVDYDSVVDTLEAEGVQKFADSFAELLDGIKAKRGELAAA